MQTEQQRHDDAPPVTRRTDGQDGPPTPAPVHTSTIGGAGLNAAITEPPLPTDSEYRRDHAAAAHLLVADHGAGTVVYPEGQPRRRKFAICGFASSSRRYIPVNDPAWEIWGLNQLYRHIPRADRWFDIHYNWDKEVVPGTDERAWAKACGIPFYLLRAEADVPTSVTYPVDRIVATFKTDYFTSTIAYMIALAALEIEDAVRGELRAKVARMRKADLAAADLFRMAQDLYATYTIGVFGVDLTVGTEYFHEKPCAEHWIGIASSRDIQVAIPPESALCKARGRYGYEPEPGSVIKTAEIAETSRALQAESLELMKKQCMIQGALELNEKLLQMVELRTRGSQVLTNALAK